MGSKISENSSLSLALVGTLLVATAGGSFWAASVNRDIQDLKASMARVEVRLGTRPKEIAHEPAQIGPQKELARPRNDWLRFPDVWAGSR